MASQFLPLLRNEVTKAARRKLPYFGVLAVGLLCVIIYFIAGELSNAATANAWGYVGFSMQLVFSDIGPIFIVVFAAMLVAEETGTGTIRAALAAPVHRWELYLAKAVTGLLYMIVLSAATLLFSRRWPKSIITSARWAILSEWSTAGTRRHNRYWWVTRSVGSR